MPIYVVEADVADRHAGFHRDGERSYGSVGIHVLHGVFVVPAVRADLDRHYGGLISWLEQHRISHSFQTEPPLRLLATSGGEETIAEDALEPGVGVVLRSADGRTRVLPGVQTDVNRPRYMESPVSMGVPRIDLDKALALAADLEDEEILRKVSLGK